MANSVEKRSICRSAQRYNSQKPIDPNTLWSERNYPRHVLLIPRDVARSLYKLRQTNQHGERRLVKRAQQNSPTEAATVRIITSRQNDPRCDANAAPNETGTSLGACHAAQVPPKSRPAIDPHAKASTGSLSNDKTPPHAAATMMARMRHRPMLTYCNTGVTSQYR